ncbi:aminoacyl-tRNA hydrolase [soil metagenome]
MGFRILDVLAARHALPDWKRRGTRLETSGGVAGQAALLVKPLTFMNRSGQALVELRRVEPFGPDELLLCYDDFALPLGRIRIRPSGSHGGHNGMESVIERLGSSSFARLRVGIAPKSGGIDDNTDFVLSPFRRNERAVIDEAVERAVDAAECVVSEGLLAAMNCYNPEPS